MTFEDVMQFTRTVSAPDALQDAECKAMFDCLMGVQPSGLVVEVGCQLGRSSSIIAQVQKEREYHCIHIDPFTDQPSYATGWIEMMLRAGDRENHAFCLLCMRTAQAQWLLSKIGEIDLAYIDGDHEYDSVLFDLHALGDRVRRGGYLLCHDYKNLGLPGVNKAITEYITPAWHTVGVFEGLGVWLKK